MKIDFILRGILILLSFVVWHLRLHFILALRVSPRWRVTLLLQPKRVTRKGRRCSIAPAGYLKLGVLPTSPPWCAVRAHKAKFAVPGEFALPIPPTSAIERRKLNKNKTKLETRSETNTKTKVKAQRKTSPLFLFLTYSTLGKPFRWCRYHGSSVPACLSPRVF